MLVVLGVGFYYATNPGGNLPFFFNVVFAAGQFNYDIGSGGVFRSDDGGQTWRNLGYDQHPDFHALAFNPANTAISASNR